MCDWVRTSVGERDFSLLHTCPDQPWGYAAVTSLTGTPREKYKHDRVDY